MSLKSVLLIIYYGHINRIKGNSMHLFYCDESNLEERSGDFLIYGGISIDANKAKDFSDEIEQIRKDASVPNDYLLKFNPGPKDLDHQEFLSLKERVIKSAVKHDVKLIVYVILHDVATSPDDARRNGINAVCYHFHCLLNRLKDSGLVLVDRFNDKGNKIDAHLHEKFSVGLKDMPYSKKIRLDNIVGFHYSAIGQSHFPSIVDIILGSLRFAINAHTRGEDRHLTTSKLLLEMLEPLFYREGSDHSVSEISFQFSPKVIKADSYRKKYESLKSFLNNSGINTNQTISDQRTY